jgi:2-amino-4-hydroxy-6-hydroxymethyldihydropteridine diphosphokinase
MTNTEKFKIVVGLGANLGDRAKALTSATNLIEQKVGKVQAVSSFFETLPLLHPDNPNLEQPNYLNAVLVLTTTKSPQEVLGALASIEQSLGRDRSLEKYPWSARVIDLDLIAYEDLILEQNGLTIPHSQMHKREFVLKPMVEVWPDWKHPKLGRTTQQLLQELS